MSAFIAVTASGTNQTGTALGIPRASSYLGIFNQSVAATVYVAFDTPAVAAATAGQLTLLPATGGNLSFALFRSGEVPRGVLNIIASAGGTPVTVVVA
jgi:hypothetical protein